MYFLLTPGAKQKPISLKFLSEPESEKEEIIPTFITQEVERTGHPACCRAMYAIDKDISTEASVEVTTNSTSWIELRFGEDYYIHKVIIYNRFYTDWYDPKALCVKSVAAFKKCVDINTNVDVSVYVGEKKKKSCGTLKLNYGLNRSDQIYTMLCKITGRAVKLSKSHGGISVQEIVMTGVAEGI
jgi:hypothetical protein